MNVEEIKPRLDADLVIGKRAFEVFSNGIREICKSEFENVAALQGRLCRVFADFATCTRNLSPIVKLIVNTAAIKVIICIENFIQPKEGEPLDTYYCNAEVCVELQTVKLVLTKRQMSLTLKTRATNYGRLDVSAYLSENMIDASVIFIKKKKQ